MQNNVLFAFCLTLIAGLSTCIGSGIAVFTKRTDRAFLSGALGFSAGVMLYVSFVEILPKAVESLGTIYSERTATIIAVVGFFVGIAIIAAIDKLMPSATNKQQVRAVDSIEQDNSKQQLIRMGLFTALAIAIHNFPEGLTTFISALEDPQTGIAITVAIAIHNIPEGIAVAAPIYYATGSRKKAFNLSFLSGLSEPLGAIVGYFAIVRFMGDEVFGLIFAAVAGIMVYISIDELLPAAEEYGEHSLAIIGFVLGMAIMAVSLILFM